MNRKQLRALSEIRLLESQALFRARHFSGAYYLAGYAIECALKACIAKQFKRYEFPDRKRVNESYTHDLKALAKLSNINQAILAQASSDPGFQANWDLVTLWSEKSRYETADRAKAKSLLDAIMDTRSGVMPWIAQHW
jgi:hypothetical protein